MTALWKHSSLYMRWEKVVTFVFLCSQTEPVNPSAPEPEGQSPATQQCREEEGQVGESAEQTGNSCLCGHTDCSPVPPSICFTETTVLAPAKTKLGVCWKKGCTWLKFCNNAMQLHPIMHCIDLVVVENGYKWVDGENGVILATSNTTNTC